jgi:hypothetical protein
MMGRVFQRLNARTFRVLGPAALVALAALLPGKPAWAQG